MSRRNTTRKIADRGPTVRQRILYALQAILLELEDGGDKVFRDVMFSDLEDHDNTNNPVAGIDRGTEEHDPTLGSCSIYYLPIFIHFRFTPERGVDKLDFYEYYLGIVQKAVSEDNNLGGLTLDMTEETNAHTILGVDDAYTGGTLHITAKYRTRLHDPYRLITEAP